MTGPRLPRQCLRRPTKKASQFRNQVIFKLSPEAVPLYRAAAQQYRKLKTLLNRLDKLSKTILRYQAELAESKPQN